MCQSWVPFSQHSKAKRAQHTLGFCTVTWWGLLGPDAGCTPDRHANTHRPRLGLPFKHQAVAIHDYQPHHRQHITNPVPLTPRDPERPGSAARRGMEQLLGQAAASLRQLKASAEASAKRREDPASRTVMDYVVVALATALALMLVLGSVAAGGWVTWRACLGGGNSMWSPSPTVCVS